MKFARRWFLVHDARCAALACEWHEQRIAADDRLQALCERYGASGWVNVDGRPMGIWIKRNTPIPKGWGVYPMGATPQHPFRRPISPRSAAVRGELEACVVPRPEELEAEVNKAFGFQVAGCWVPDNGGLFDICPMRLEFIGGTPVIGLAVEAGRRVPGVNWPYEPPAGFRELTAEEAAGLAGALRAV